MKWEVMLFAENKGGLSSLGEVTAETGPDARRAAWAKWPEHAKQSEQFPNGRLWVQPMRVIPGLTEPQRKVLFEIEVLGGMRHLYGVAVRVARRLEVKGLVSIRDDGSFGGTNHNRDGERWVVEITEVGRALLAANKEV